MGAKCSKCCRSSNDDRINDDFVRTKTKNLHQEIMRYRNNSVEGSNNIITPDGDGIKGYTTGERRKSQHEDIVRDRVKSLEGGTFRGSIVNSDNVSIKDNFRDRIMSIHEDIIQDRIKNLDAGIIRDSIINPDGDVIKDDNIKGRIKTLHEDIIRDRIETLEAGIIRDRIINPNDDSIKDDSIKERIKSLHEDIIRDRIKNLEGNIIPNGITTSGDDHAVRERIKSLYEDIIRNKINTVESSKKGLQCGKDIKCKDTCEKCNQVTFQGEDVVCQTDQCPCRDQILQTDFTGETFTKESKGVVEKAPPTNSPSEEPSTKNTNKEPGACEKEKKPVAIQVIYKVCCKNKHAKCPPPKKCCPCEKSVQTCTSRLNKCLLWRSKPSKASRCCCSRCSFECS